MHDFESAIRVYVSRHVRVADNEVFHISVDGLQFSGDDIAIRDNLIRDQIATPDKLHPDCMQGQQPPGQLIDPARGLDLPADLPFMVEEIDSSPAIVDAADALSRFPQPSAFSRD
ncbi:MAG: hypothetical protein RIC51_12065 [Erythrobacter sp.]|uniref:hypothetical protein n=1 Tax=Erythrobacter sp. TaxID=1042 RepID=UPI0032EF50CE